MVGHYSEYTWGHILVFFVQFYEGKSLGAGGRYFIYDPYSVPIYTELRLKEWGESLIAGSYAIFWLRCPRWTTGGCRGGNDEIALASKNVASSLYF